MHGAADGIRGCVTVMDATRRLVALASTRLMGLSRPPGGCSHHMLCRRRDRYRTGLPICFVASAGVVAHRKGQMEWVFARRVSRFAIRFQPQLAFLVVHVIFRSESCAPVPFALNNLCNCSLSHYGQNNPYACYLALLRSLGGIVDHAFECRGAKPACGGFRLVVTYVPR